MTRAERNKNMILVACSLFCGKDMNQKIVNNIFRCLFSHKPLSEDCHTENTYNL